MKRIGVLAVALLVSCGIAAFFFAAPSQQMRAHESKEWVEFAQWLVKFQKEYANEWELMERFGIFRANKHMIEAHNAEKHNWTMGVNQFTDLTIQEFQEIYLNSLVIEDFDEGAGTEELIGEVADSIDWQARGAVTTVKNQGRCGSCWAFSAVATYEGSYQQRYRRLREFSEQQLVDCSRAYGNYGCSGGWPSRSFQYWQRYGVALRSSYAYTGRNDQCKYTSSMKAAGVSGYQRTSTNEDGLKRGSNAYVVSVCIDASNWGSYRGGIFSGSCSSNRINHAVTLTGYGTENGQSYWRIKNSWGTWWGEQGYIKLKRNAGSYGYGACGVAKYAYYVKAQ